MKGAFEPLISEQYSLLILTVGCVAVDIVDCAENRHKVFDSLTRDIYGKRVTGHFAQKNFSHKSFSTSFGRFTQFLVVVLHNYK